MEKYGLGEDLVLGPNPLFAILLSDYSGLDSLMHEGPKQDLHRARPCDEFGD
jgi:hypothetical protein